VESLINNAPVPGDPITSVDEILKLAFDRTKEFGTSAGINQAFDYPLVYAKSSEEFRKLIGAAEKLGYIEITPGGLVILTLRGWGRVGELKKVGPANNRVAFMAMRFNDKRLDDIYRDYLQPAIAQTGFELKRVDEGQPAGLIDDQLRVRIRNSKFLLAQLAAHNNGVYWEAGYADGLGRPVIYLCDEKDENPHFDTNHFTTVYWNENELDKAMEKLKATIRATFPSEAKMMDDD
jgi:nucleoside 2-deoxyribosyltransferase